jgi:hypothetical protein
MDLLVADTTLRFLVVLVAVVVALVELDLQT